MTDQLINMNPDGKKNSSRNLHIVLRAGLDALYKGSGLLAAGILFIMLVIIILQMASRWLGLQFPGSSDYAAYCMAASSFFALAYTLNHNAHIRVSLVLNCTQGLLRKLLDIWCLSIASLLAGYLSYYAARNVHLSHLIDDISQGQDATPLWIPQMAVMIGSAIFTLALLDKLVQAIFSACSTNHSEEKQRETK
jgi:TRAP-type C4-dicarboxylate transport system permease small subunit